MAEDIGKYCEGGPVSRRQVLGGMAAGIGASSFISRSVAAPKITLRYVSFTPQSAFFGHFYRKLRDEVATRSNGEIAVAWAGGPEVVPAFQAAEAVSKGVFDICFSTFSYYANAVPEGIGVQTALANINALYDTGTVSLLDQIHRKRLGVALFGLPFSGVGYGFLTKKPIRQLSDFKGRRIRSTPIYDAFLSKLGAASVTISPTETYTAIERGVADGLGWPLVSLVSLRFHEVAKNLVLPSFYHAIAVHLMNAKKLDGMPKEAKDVLMAASRATDEWGYAFCRSQSSKEREIMKKAGVTEHSLPGEEAQQYLSMARSAMWQHIEKVAPDNAKALRTHVEKAAGIK